MSCKIFFIAVMILVYSCNRKVTLITPVYSACCFDQDRSVCFSKEEITILENNEMFTKEGAKKYDYLINIIKINTDTLKEIDSSINIYNYEKTIGQMKQKLFYYDSIGKIKFVYNEIPAELNLKFSNDEKIDHLITYKDKYIFTTVNFGTKVKDDSERTRLYIQSKNNNDVEVVNLDMHSYPTPEILLYDFLGDAEPEIFIINNYYFMNHYLTSFDIYKINFN